MLENLRIRNVISTCIITMGAFGVIETYTWLRVVSIILLVLMLIVDYVDEKI